MKNALTKKLIASVKLSFLFAFTLIFTSNFVLINKKGVSPNQSSTNQNQLQTKNDVTVLLTKPGNFNWTFVLEDSESNIVNMSNNINETVAIKNLKSGIYTIWELNPYGCGSVYSFKINSSGSKLQYVCISDEKVAFDVVFQTTSLDLNKTTEK